MTSVLSGEGRVVVSVVIYATGSCRYCLPAFPTNLPIRFTIYTGQCMEAMPRGSGIVYTTWTFILHLARWNPKRMFPYKVHRQVCWKRVSILIQSFCYVCFPPNTEKCISHLKHSMREVYAFPKFCSGTFVKLVQHTHATWEYILHKEHSKG